MSGKALFDIELGQFVETHFQVAIESSGPLIGKHTSTMISKRVQLSVEDN
jgi:hypothetical protein